MNISHRRLFPKQEEKMAIIEQIIETTIQAVFIRIITLMPEHRHDYLLRARKCRSIE